jgi:hypothetical protein
MGVKQPQHLVSTYQHDFSLAARGFRSRALSAGGHIRQSQTYNMASARPATRAGPQASLQRKKAKYDLKFHIRTLVILKRHLYSRRYTNTA